MNLLRSSSKFYKLKLVKILNLFNKQLHMDLELSRIVFQRASSAFYLKQSLFASIYYLVKMLLRKIALFAQRVHLVLLLKWPTTTWMVRL